MKRYLSVSFLCLLFLTLIGCSTPRSSYMKMDLTQERWMQAVDTNPMKWMRGASPWFLTGNPNAGVRIVQPFSAAMSTTSVRVPNFSKIKVNGNFKVQLFGTEGPNTVYVYGTNDTVRMVSVTVRGNTLCIDQPKKASNNIRHVIVRIGVNRLSDLIHAGRGCVEGIQLRSDHLNIISAGPGNIYLAGNMNVSKIIKTNSGSVSVFGANTPLLDIKTSGIGVVNVSGNVGVRSIVHHGKTNVNIIGANTNSLSILADGKGKIGVQGIVNLRAIQASDATEVYVSQAVSGDVTIRTSGKARVGVAGTARNINIDACKQSCVSAKNLCTEIAYARSHDAAHINISSNKIFAAATGNSSIYFFGPPDFVSQFVSGNGVVIPIWTPSKFCAAAIRPVVPVQVKPVYPHNHKAVRKAKRKMLPGEG